jgi:hypothetical protein
MSSVEPLPSKAQLDFEQLAVKLAVGGLLVVGVGLVTVPSY